jgi:putative ABC transport system permease protein
MTLLSLAYHSLKNRQLTSALTLGSIALSVALLIGVEQVRLGARGGALQLLLYTVFRVGSATNNIAYESYARFRDHPALAWTIPYSLGDSHRGFRVVGTTEDSYTKYRYRCERQIELAEGRIPAAIFEVALGADAAAELKYCLGERVVITHGITHSRGILKHDDKPFTVVGVLKRTATPIDRSLYLTLG